MANDSGIDHFEVFGPDTYFRKTFIRDTLDGNWETPAGIDWPQARADLSAKQTELATKYRRSVIIAHSWKGSRRVPHLLRPSDLGSLHP